MTRITPLLAALAIGSALAAEPSPDRYDPARLDAIALERARAGEWAAARIMLERAARLVPGDARIARNLEDVRAGRVPSAPPPAAASAATVPATSPSRELPPEPPPLWAPKK